MASRSRRYINHPNGTVIPMSLGPQEISLAIDSYGSPLPRKQLDMIIFYLDDKFLTLSK